MRHYEKRRRAQTAAVVVGIDAGKRKHALALRPRGGEDSKPIMFDTTRRGFETALQAIRAAAPDAAPADVLVGIEFAGNYGFTFAHFLRDQGHQVVSVLGSHSKRWKEVVHNQPLKTDPSDAITITDLVAQGRFVGFPFLEQVYADLRYLVSTRQRLLKLRNGAINRLKEVLQVVWPEFERRHRDLTQKTPIALLQEFPGPAAFLAAPKRRVLRVMKEASRNHLKLAHYEELAEGARHTTP